MKDIAQYIIEATDYITSATHPTGDYDSVPTTTEELRNIVVKRYNRNKRYVDMKDVNVSNIESFEGVFENLKHCQTIDITGWDTSKATDMSWMFYGCGLLKEIIGINLIDVSNVTNMYCMFGESFVHVSLDLSNWDVSNVTNMRSMFTGGRSMLYRVDATGWDTSKVTDMNKMFWGQSCLQEVAGIEDWDISNVKNMANMFRACNSLDPVKFNISNWNVRKDCDIENMFKQIYPGNKGRKAIPKWAKKSWLF